MAEENEIALIESYLQGELSAEREQEVEERLKADADFKSLFDDTKVMIEGLNKLRHKSLLGRIDQLELGLGNPLEVKEEVKTIFWTVQRIAATFIGLAVVALASWYIIRDDGTINGVALYEEYHQVYPNVLVPTTRSEEELTLITKTFRAYDQQVYDSAGLLFTELLKEDKREFVRFYAALAYIEMDKSNLGIDMLKTIISEKGDFQTQAIWYLALNYIKREEYNNAKSLLKELAGSSTTYQEKAQQLLSKMK